MKPSAALRVVAPQVSPAANAGAPHGAATMPDVAPSRNTPGYDPPVSRPAHCSRRCGADTGNTSSMARPNTSSRFPIAKRAQGLALTVPNSEPLGPLRDREPRSEEHTSELQSQSNLVCRLLLVKKKTVQPAP